jgi:hypothetical protein
MGNVIGVDMAEVKIEKASNGYEVEFMDPDIKKQNESGKGPWKDPERKMLFMTSKEVVTFLSENLEKLCGGNSGYDTAFMKAVMEKK